MLMAARSRLAAGAATTILALLTAQFLLGMAVNLTVHAPHARFAVGSMMAVMRGQPLLMIHMMIGMLVALLALLLALIATSARRPGTAISAICGLAGVLVAGYGGIRFLLSGGNGASFTMATGFLVAYAAYFIELLTVLRPRPPGRLPSASASRWPRHLFDGGEQDPAEILAQRYAGGEISSEEYKERRRALEHARTRPAGQ